MQRISCPDTLCSTRKDQSVNKSFTQTLYLQAIDVVRMGDASAEAFEHMSAGLKALLVSRAPFAEKRDGLGFEDRQGNMLAGVLRGNGEIEFVANGGADREVSVVSVNALGGLSAPEKAKSGRQADE